MTAVEGQPSSYPTRWEADVVLLDGRAAHLRPIRPDDADALVDFYDNRVSNESKYLRFFAPYPHLSDRDVEYFTHVDHVQRVAFVVTVGEAIIGIGRYDAMSKDEAEVAFLISDAHQGRGLGQLLLEHLAQAGRENGLKKFVAEVLPENGRMVQVFRDAGYQVRTGIEEGVLHLVFPIDATETSLSVMQSREHRAEARSIERFFKARSVAVIGASRRPGSIGMTLVRNLVLGGYTGRVYAVNLAAEPVSGLPAFASVNDIPEPVDLAIVAVPAEHVEDIVLDCAAKGVHGLVVISSGFAETGAEGRRRQRRLVGLARSYGLRLIGPNALGVINTNAKQSLNASLSTLTPPHGRVGFFCQSGALGVAILESVERRGLGISSFVSAGNRADVSGNDLLQYWEEDEDTEVVLLYLESIGNPRKFSRIARRVARRKPIVAVKSGRTTQGVPVGHAVRATIASAAAVDAMFRQAGVIQVDTLDEMFDVAQLLAHQPLPKGPRVAVVGNSDALGLLATDAATAAGLQVKEPIALGPEATADDFERALDSAVDDPEVDAVVAVFIPPLNTPGDQVAQVLAAVGEQSDKPLISTFLAAEGVPELLRVPDVEGAAGRGSVPSYLAPDAGVRALARVVEYAAWCRRPAGEVAVYDEIDSRLAHRTLAGWLRGSSEAVPLEEPQLRELLRLYGIHLWPRIAVGTMEEAIAAGEELGWDCVLKATAPHLVQRPDMSHVARDIESAAKMREAWTKLHERIDHPATAGFVVQRMAPPGLPLSIACVEDQLFGPLMSFGVAGMASELLDDRAYRNPPITDLDAAAMVREIKAAPLLFGYRSGEEVDVARIEDLLQRMSRLKSDLPEVSTLELSLVQAGAKACSVLAASGRIAPTGDLRSDWFVRRMTPVGESTGGTLG
jgi:acyl-CoA synthetase (NDP forming)/RimJ/RimL family protein N-acetyltransferase